MREKTLYLLIIFTLALVVQPIQTGLMAGHHLTALSTTNHVQPTGADDCEISANATRSEASGGHTHADGDDCCGDHCTSSQMLLPTSLKFPEPETGYHPTAWSLRLPDLIVTAEYRPPIQLS